jgi:predicted aspartyl protease
VVTVRRDDDLSGVPYERNGVPRPVLVVDVSDPLRRTKAELLTRVDTGFEGGLLIPLERYIGLGLQEFEEGGGHVARSAQGVAVRVRASRGIVSVLGQDFECAVYTTPILLRSLLGMELLNKWRVTLDGPQEELTVARSGDGGAV